MATSVSATREDLEQVRAWLADQLEQTAEWRSFKADEYPEDERNRSSALALKAAEEWVRHVEDSVAVRSIANLAVELRSAHGYDLTAGGFGFESSRVAGRYGFDRDGFGLSAANSHEMLLTRLCEAFRSEARDAVGEWDDELPETPHPRVETQIIDQRGRQLAILDKVALWPPQGARIQLGNPNRDAVVRDVRMLLTSAYASVCVDVDDPHEDPFVRDSVRE